MNENVCPVCGNPIPQNSGTFVSLGDSKYLPVCDRCGVMYAHSCVTCSHEQPPAPQCLLEKYHGPLDIIKMVRVQQRMGPAFIVQEAPQVNVEVIEQVCHTCSCGSPWNCQRFHICENWELKKELNKYVVTA